MDLNTTLLVSQSTNPFFNLALEEWLLRKGNEGFGVLVYRNRPSVIMGRNQNPWLECDLEFIASHDILLVRRISGGGAVYHDPGNTNFTFIMPRDMYNPKTYLRFTAQALEALGVQASITDRHNLFVGGAKISGTAFMLTGKRALQHGTLLINANLDHLQKSLRPPTINLETHAVLSVPDRVINLSSIVPDITHKRFIKALYDILQRRCAKCSMKTLLATDFNENDTFLEYFDKQRNWDWIYGKTPTFVQHLSLHPRAPQKSIALKVHRGRISEVTSSNERDSEVQHLYRDLIGQQYNPQILHKDLHLCRAPN